MTNDKRKIAKRNAASARNIVDIIMCALLPLGLDIIPRKLMHAFST
jgi:hypothetical protein